MCKIAFNSAEMHLLDVKEVDKRVVVLHRSICTITSLLLEITTTNVGS